MTPLEKLFAQRPDLRPFDPAADEDYRRWRDAKLASYPRDIGELVVDVKSPVSLTRAEYGALHDRLLRANMAIYRSPGTSEGDERQKLVSLARRFGLHVLDGNYLADEDGISSVTQASGARGGYIPYTDRPIGWHTDGYYNPPARHIRAMILHCVYDAGSGGSNRLLDPELLYLHVRASNPEYIKALMREDALTIPPGRDDQGKARGAVGGPVFTVDEFTGALYTRYTARKRNAVWSDDLTVRAAAAFVSDLLQGGIDEVLRVRLEPGMGLLSNNVLHDRSGYMDRADGPRRLVLRARFIDRVAGTAPRDWA